jgi:MerR family transcriptional regulator, light-induced transcriptional regulator
LGVKKSGQITLNGTVDLKSAADELGVHYQTAYRWVREGALSAVKVGASYEVPTDEVDRFRARRNEPSPPPMRAKVRSWPAYVDRLYDAIVLGDELMARNLVDRLFDSGSGVIELCERLFTPALKRVGDSWDRGRLSVADEHRAAAMCTRLLARISVHPRGRPRGVAVVTTVPGESHELPGMMAAMALRADRWRVHHLGTQLPYDQLAGLARREYADLVVLSVTDPAARRASVECGERVESELGLRALVGRPGATLTELVDLARR